MCYQRMVCQWYLPNLTSGHDNDCLLPHQISPHMTGSNRHVLNTVRISEELATAKCLNYWYYVVLLVMSTTKAPGCLWVPNQRSRRTHILTGLQQQYFRSRQLWDLWISLTNTTTWYTDGSILHAESLF